MSKKLPFQLFCGSLFLIFGYTGVFAQGIMTTWVGDSAGYSGDNGPANMALINDPYDVCFDGAGNFYIADQGNYAIRKISTSDIITTIAGNGTTGYSGDGGPATAALLSLVYGLCTDATGNVYLSDMGNHVVRKINTSGIISTIAGNGTDGSSGDGGPATAAQLSEPQGLCVSAGALYITDYSKACVRMLDLTTGIITSAAGTGVPGYTGDGGPASLATLNGPSSICADLTGDLYIADETNFVIRKIAAGTGIITTIAGTGTEGYSGDDSAAVLAKIGFIDGICTDNFGSVYINDLSCSSRKINTTTGIITTMAGSGTVSGFSGDGGPATAELLNWPAGVCIDPATGNIIIADQFNNRIRKATQPGFFTPEKTPVPTEIQPVVYPNPSTGIFSIQVPGDLNYSQVDVIRITCERVYTCLLKESITQINLSGLPGGNYIISVTSPAGKTFTQNIVFNQ